MSYARTLHDTSNERVAFPSGVIDAAQKMQVTVREVKEREESGDKEPIKR